jgi:hypothetical protein
MGIGSPTEVTVLARLSTETARRLNPDAHGTEPETAASPRHLSFLPPELASIRLRMFS